MKNCADQGGCYPKRTKAEVDNIVQDLQNSSYPTKAEFNNNCFIIHSKYFAFTLFVFPLSKYLIRTNFREALISRFSRFVKNREIKDSLKLGCAKIKHAKFNTLL